MLTTRTKSAALAALLLVSAAPAWAGGTHLVVPGDGETPPPDTTITSPSDDGTGGDGWASDFGVQTQPGPEGSTPSGKSGGCTVPAVAGAPDLPYSCVHACWYGEYSTDHVADTNGSFESGFKQPSPDNPVEGHTDGKYYQCKNKIVDGRLWALSGYPRWWAGPGGETVDPARLAQQAVASMGLRVPQIGMTGGSPPDGMQIVGIPAWMWAADPGESTTPGVGGVSPITRSATAGGVTVTATARLERTTWSMGDGATVTRSGKKAAGTPYEGRYDKQPSPTCGHMYTRTSAGQPDQAYTVVMTALWVVEWSGGGQSGSIDVQRSRNIPKQVGELQALIVGPDGERR